MSLPPGSDLKAPICISVADNTAAKCQEFLSSDVETLYADAMLGLTKVPLSLTVLSSALSFTLITACHCRLKIERCHHFDATGDDQVDHLPGPAGFHTAGQEHGHTVEAHFHQGDGKES